MKDVFLPYQKKWLADKASVKVVEKSRRIGLTWAQAHDDTLLAATSGRYGMDVLYISFNQDMTREYIEACADWAKRLQLVAGKVNEDVFKDGDEREIKAFRIDFASGRKILALSNRPSNLRGKQGRVIIDEAAFVEDLPELLKAALALLMWGGQVIIISTHNGADNAFNQLVQDVRAGTLPYSLHRITLDEALDPGGGRRLASGAYQDLWGRSGRRTVLHSQTVFRGLPDHVHDRSLHGGCTGADLDASGGGLRGLAAACGGTLHQGVDNGTIGAAAGLAAPRYGAFLRRGLRTQRRPFRFLARHGRTGSAPGAALHP
ncbi:hypothetical protein [uncultured Desulfovibrio sp.]|uniref:hypothetical protein n=1 Tax=uncultured Desulfovibrio sp. TaxID=167968 RepID=UPI00266F3C38|nr:hypothetical protein [uncultured Desulfovibrio sp.]